ncbi:MAG: hypothetical protein Q9170_001461 [Blastenia crenularia]
MSPSSPVSDSSDDDYITYEWSSDAQNLDIDGYSLRHVIRLTVIPNGEVTIEGEDVVEGKAERKNIEGGAAEGGDAEGGDAQGVDAEWVEFEDDSDDSEDNGDDSEDDNDDYEDNSDSSDEDDSSDSEDNGDDFEDDNDDYEDDDDSSEDDEAWAFELYRLRNSTIRW